MYVVLFPREKKLTKAELAKEVAVTTAMALVSSGGIVDSGRLMFRLFRSPDEGADGVPYGWFAGESNFNVVVIRLLNALDFHTLYEYCNVNKVPVSRGNYKGDWSCMVIGPYWDRVIEGYLSLSVPQKSNLRRFN